MRVEDIVDIASTDIKNGTLVLHKSIKVHPKFKIYKIFCYDLYFVNGKNKEHIYTHEEVKNITTDDVNKLWSTYDRIFLRWFFRWMIGDEFKAMLKDGI